MRRIFAAAGLFVLLAGCSGQKATVTRNPYLDGAAHKEPVFYNGKHYDMRFRYLAASNSYDINIAGRGGRKLGNKPGDAKIVREVVVSALRHFACARGQKGHVVPGSIRHESGSWRMQARCL